MRVLMLALLVATWWCTTFLAGLWAHIPILALFVPLLIIASLVSWVVYFAVLQPAAGATPGRRAIAWVLAVAGGLLLILTVTSFGGFIGGELLALEREVYDIARIYPGLHLWSPFMSQVGLGLVGWMALWLGELSLLCVAVRLRAGWELKKLLLLGAAFSLIPPLIPFLILLLDLPLSA